MKENIVAIIPARGGSKRIKEKNIKKFKGDPAISSTIKKLKKSKIFSRILVSTDSSKIMKISKKAGADIPFARPKNLSSDYVSDFSVITHCIKFLNYKNYKFNYVCYVYPVNPFLRISDLKKGLIKIKKRKTGFVFSAVKYQFPFFRSFIVSKKKIKMIFKEYYKKRSQDLKQIFCDAGQFYWGSKNTWLNEKTLFSQGSNIIAIPKWRYHDIDTLDDWKKAEKITDIDLK